MPIGPADVENLLDVYADLTANASTITNAVSRVAPAAVAEVLCSVGGLASLGAGPFGPLQSPGTANRLLSDLGGILASACPVPPEVPQPLPPPLLPPGTGQCSGVTYRIDFTTQEIDRFACNPFTRQNTAFVLGPLGNPLLTNQDLSFCSEYPDLFVRLEIPAGEPASSVLLRQPGGNVRIFDFTIDSVVRVDGLPDDCGTLAPSVPPRPPISQPVDSPQIPTTNPDGSPGSPIIFKPRVGPIYVDADGQISVPVVVNVEGPQYDTDISFPVTVNLPDFSPSFEYGGNGGGTDGTPQPDEPTPREPLCCDPPLPRLEDGEEENPEDPPPPEEEEVTQIIGVVVSAMPDGNPVRSSELFTATPTLNVPRIATVQFGVSIDGVEYTSLETQVKRDGTYVPAPEGVKVIRAFVGFEPGWTGGFQYVEVPSNPMMR